ncbi:MAG: hypothetical protein K2X74_12920 [Acetobacteraceae bacterium]|nr:hypothetical protein [Acetobacteraceae bacterium]
MPGFLRRNATLLVLSAVALLAATLVWLSQGPAAVNAALDKAWPLLLAVLPAMVAGLLLAGSLKQLVPPGALARWMGANSGWRGLVIASLAGMATPGGPMAAFPLVLVLARAGADRGAVICYVVSWALNGLQRILVWEVPLLGADFALLRLASGLPLGVLAGLIARRLPIAWSLPDSLPEPRPGRGPRA